MKQTLKERYDILIEEYIQAFVKKHEYEFDGWIANDNTGIAIFIDQYFFNVGDIMYDINNKCKKNLIFEWQDYCMDETNENINFHSYCKGLRISKEK